MPRQLRAARCPECDDLHLARRYPHDDALNLDWYVICPDMERLVGVPEADLVALP